MEAFEKWFMSPGWDTEVHTYKDVAQAGWLAALEHAERVCLSLPNQAHGWAYKDCATAIRREREGS